jgi:hypothetical protein
MRKTTHTLAVVSASRARSFLFELANLRDEVEAGKRFLLKFVGLWPEPGRLHGPLINENVSHMAGSKPENEQIDEMMHSHWILPLREGLRSVWTAPDLRMKQWGIFRILDEVVFQEDPSSPRFWPFWQHPSKVACLPVPIAFEQALLYLLRPGVRTGLCTNPECPARYFFPHRKGQKYCSAPCAQPAQREFKRNWWAAHGSALRRSRGKGRRRTKRNKGNALK